jgi:hypothetical protein
VAQSQISVLLEAIDQLWNHRFESILGVLDGIGEEEAGWAAPFVYESIESRGVQLRPGSVHWHVNHVSGCKLNYISEIRHLLVSVSPLRETDALEPAASFAAELERLGEIHREQRELVASLDDSDLERKTTDGTPILQFVVACTRHDIWHGGQMAVARRLYRTRG